MNVQMLIFSNRSNLLKCRRKLGIYVLRTAALNVYPGSLELFHILGGEGGHGDPAEDLWDLLSGHQAAQGVGAVPGGGQEPGPPQAGPGMVHCSSHYLLLLCVGTVSQCYG